MDMPTYICCIRIENKVFKLLKIASCQNNDVKLLTIVFILTYCKIKKSYLILIFLCFPLQQFIDSGG